MEPPTTAAMDPDVERLTLESRRWLLDRLPAPLRDAAVEYRMSGDVPGLVWAAGGRGMTLRFDAPHRIACRTWDGPDGTADTRVLNLAMNLQEITDLVRMTMEGR